MKTLITGGTGFIGSALVTALRERGHEVCILSRRKTPDTLFWDPNNGSIDLEGFKPEGVVHLAGEPIAARRWNPAQKKRIQQSRVKGTRFLAKILAKQEPKPSIFCSGSAIGYYGNQEDEIITEEDPAGNGFLAEIGEEWEDAARPAEAAGIRTVFLRTGIVLDQQGGALANMLPPFRLGLGGKMGDGDQMMSWISLEDEVRAICFLLEHPDAVGPYNLTAPQPVSNAFFAEALGKALHRPAVLPMPSFAARLLLGEMADELLLRGAHILPEKLLEAGFTFQHPTLDIAFKNLL